MDLSVFSRSPLFKGVTAAGIEKVFAHIPYRVRKFKTGSLIAHSGEELTSLMLVAEGIVKGEMVDYTGRIIKIEDIPSSGVLASGFLFGSRNSFPVNVTATSDTTLVIIEKENFLRLLKTDNNILVNFLDMISNRSQFLSEKIKFLNFKTIKGKLVQFILQRTSLEKPTCRLEMTQAELADYFGVARPSVARALKEMEEENLIVATGKQIRVTDRNKLAEFLNS
jgi:CRP/FNR family transcriptional regulator, dissimilatory nitrate respiration regulator